LAIAVGVIAVVFGILRYRRNANKKSFASKTVIITGASAGIGEQLAYRYSKEGSRLFLSGRRKDRLQEVADRCIQLGAIDAKYLPGDLSEENYNKELIDTVVKEYGGIDLLILNAGVGCLVRVEDMPFPPSDDIRTVVNTNFWSCIWLTTLSLSYLKKSKGSIAFISSLSAVFPVPRRALYGATKTGLNNFFKSLSIEERDIDITVICPGFVLTELHDRAVSAKGGLPKRKTENFMSAEECANICAHSIAIRESIHVMTWIAWIGSFITPLFPNLLDQIVAKYSESSVVKE